VKWIVFTIVQVLGCAMFMGAARYNFGAENDIGAALFSAYRYLLLPGNVIGGVLLSTFDLHLRYVAFLSLAVVLNAGFWILCVIAFRLMREHFSGAKPHRYAIAFIVVTVTFVVVNVVHYHIRPARCADCLFPHGVPFHLYHEGGFAGGEAIMWPGLAADIAIVLAVSICLGGTWQRLSAKRST
jgi:hypothetical protein